jgi:pimeloyl-ACP methyl ester carboxylesterase/class 3 adenylate cyclase
MNRSYASGATAKLTAAIYAVYFVTLSVGGVPETHYATSGEVQIAYQAFGSGPDLVWVPGWVSQLDLYWEEPALARFLRRLATFARVIVFDRRGLGLSDRVAVARLPTLEARMDDVRAVLDDLGVRRASVVGQGYSCPIALLFAATYPERTTSLVLYAPSAKGGLRTDDHQWGATPDEHEAWIERSTRLWGTREFAAEWLERLAPSAAGDDRVVEWTARVLRGAGSPAASRALSHMNAAMDVRAILPSVHVPTLVVARDAATNPKGGVDVDAVEEAEWVVEQMPNASLVVTPGRDYLPWVGEQDALVDEIATFVTGVRPAAREPDRVLATVLFTDLVRSTERVAELGDERWRALRAEHDEAVRRLLARFDGREVDVAGDGFLATFDGPGRAVRCALEIVSDLELLGLDVRAGVHTGEVEIVGQGIGGIAVHIGARVAALGGAGEVLVTRTVKDLTAGSGIAYEKRGAQTLRGVPGEWELFAAGGVGVR